MVEKCDCVVIGAGVVGLAVARQLAVDGRDVLVLEAAETFGTVTSSRNSEVVHAGLYYPAGSLKARLCRRGRDLLYRYLEEHGIEHLRCGKLVVATDELRSRHAARRSKQRAHANGVDDLRWLSGDEASALEPEVRCRAALLSPSTGIFDSHGYMLSLKGEAEIHRAAFAFHARLRAARSREDGIALSVSNDGDNIGLLCRTVINCAGLGAQDVARLDPRPAGGNRPALHYLQGQLLLPGGSAAIHHAGLSAAGPRQRRPALHTRSRGSRPLRAGC